MTFEIKVQILKMTLHQKSGHRIKTPSSKLAFLVSSCWEKNFIRDNTHNFFILAVPSLLEIIDCKCCILAGPPCIVKVFLLSAVQNETIFFKMLYFLISFSNDCKCKDSCKIFSTSFPLMLWKKSTSLEITPPLSDQIPQHWKNHQC